MYSLHERFLAAMTTHKRRTDSRRGLLVGSVKLVGSGVLALAVAGAPSGREFALTSAQDFADDLEILNYALTLERLEYAFYRDGLTTLDREAFAEARRPKEVFPNLEAIRDHEHAHVDALVALVRDLGGEPVEETTFDFPYTDVDDFIALAAAIENTGVAAYADAAAQIQDKDLLATVLGIYSVEARHSAYLNARAGKSPFPEAFDEPKPKDEVLPSTGQ